MPQAVTLNLVLYADNTCLIYNSEVKEIEKQFIEDFENIFDWNFDTKHFNFGENQSNFIYSASNQAKNIRQLNIKCKHINTKQQ